MKTEDSMSGSIGGGVPESEAFTTFGSPTVWVVALLLRGY